MTNLYKHTQTGKLIIYLMLFEIAIFLGLMKSIGEIKELSFILILVIFILSLFSTLTVTVDEDYLRLKFGPGLIRKKFLRSEIISAAVVKNPWYYGFGIRYTPDGWLYNVSGFEAVEIKLKNGKKVRVGTNDAENLKNVI